MLLRARRRGRRDRRPRGHGVRRRRPGCRRSAARSSRCRACAARYDDVFLPLYGAHQAQNAAVALAAVEAFAGDQPLDEELVARGVRRGHLARAGSRSSGAARRSCSTPRTTRTAPRRRPRRSRTRSRSTPLIGVIGVMADKDDEGLLAALRAAPRARRLHPELHRPRAARRAAGRGRASRSSARTGSPSRPGSPTPSTRPRRWPRPARPSATRSAPARCWSPARWSPWARPARCCSDRDAVSDPQMRATRRPPRAALAAARHVRGGADPRGDHARAHDPGDDHHRRRAAGHRAGGRARPGGGLPGARRDAARASGPTRSAG